MGEAMSRCPTIISGHEAFRILGLNIPTVHHNDGDTLQFDSGDLRGVFSPVVTPFKADLSPDPERLAKHCRWLLTNNVGLAVFGTNSEANSMSVEEKIDLLDYLVDAGIDPLRMMPGTGCSAITDSVRLTAHATNL